MTGKEPLRTKHENKNWIWIIVSILACFCILLLINYFLASNLGAGKSFLLAWEKYRGLILKGNSPYELTSQSSFDQPLFAILGYLPFILMKNGPFAAAAWLALCQAMYIGSIFLLIRLIHWKPERYKIAIVLLLIIMPLFSILGLFQGQGSCSFLLLLVGLVWSIEKRQDEFTGVLLSVLMVRPIHYAHIIVFILLWSAFNRRGKVFLWFMIALGILIAVGALILPDWMLQWLKQVLIEAPQSLGYTLTGVLTNLWGEFGTRLGTTLSILSIALLLIEWWIHRFSSGRSFLWALAMTLTLGYWIGVPIRLDSLMQIAVPLVLIFAILDERWKSTGNLFSLLIGVVVVLIPWILNSSSGNMKLGESSSDPVNLLIFPLLFVPLLYWVRWWCNHPPEMWFDSVRKSFKI